MPRRKSRQPESTASAAARRFGFRSARRRCEPTTTQRRSARAPRGSRRITLGHGQHVARVVVEIRRRGHAAGRGRAPVPRLRVRREDDAEAGLPDPQAPLDVLDVREQLLVEEADPLGRLARDRHRRTGRATHVAQPVVPARVPLAPTGLAPVVAEAQVHLAARIHEHVGRLLEVDLAREDAGVRPRARGHLERGGEAGVDPRVVVQEQQPVRAALERPAQSKVVAAGEAEVGAGADQLQLREAALDFRVRSVGRAVVHHDRLDSRGPEGLERARRVVAAVPVEDDRDQERVKWAIEPAFARRVNSRSRSTSPATRTTPA